MDNLLFTLGRLSGFIGLLLCAVSGFMRVAGKHWIGGFETLTLLQVGVAGMTLACFLYLTLLAQKAMGK